MNVVKKIVSTILLTLVLVSLAYSQTDFIIVKQAKAQETGYYIKEVSSLIWFEPSSEPILKGDDAGTWVTLDPSWPFYCDWLTVPVKLKVYICTNGFLIFEPTSATNDWSNSLSELASRWMIAPFWDDLRTDAAGGVASDPGVYFESDAWKYVITWKATRYGDSSDSVIFQAVLWYNGSLWISIKDATNFNDFTPTIGISKGDNVNYVDLTSERQTGKTWKFTIADEINRALALGKRWLDRMYFEISPTQAVIKDYPALPLRVYDAAADKWYRSGQLDERVRIETIQSGNIDEAYYYFNTDDDDDWNEPKIYIKYWSLDSERTCAYVKMESCSGRSDPQNLEVYLGDHYLGTCDTSFEKTIIDWGFASHQYVTRHSTRMAQRYYAAIGDTNRAAKLENFLTAQGYTNRDVYDPLFEASNSYPDDFFTDPATFPDPELWGNLPSGPNYHPYGTRLQKSEARGIWVTCIETNTPRYDSLYALHLLNKYGSSKLSEALERIKSARWDGFGVRRWVKIAGLVEAPRYTAYPGYTLGPFLAAVAKYASMTNDPEYLAIADRAAGILLDLQWKYPDETTQWGKLYRAEHVGGFKTGYLPSGSFAWQPTWSDFTDQFFWLLDRLGYWRLNPPEMPGPAVTSSECTIMSMQALRLYKKLLPGRTPSYPGAGIKLNIQQADTTVTEGGGFYWIANADKKGQMELYVTSVLFTSSEAKASLKYNFVPEDDIVNPKISYAIHDKGMIYGGVTGWAGAYQWMKLWQGSTLLFSTEVERASVAWAASKYIDDYNELSYLYIGTLQKGVTYTLEVGYRVACDDNGVCRFIYDGDKVEVLWVSVEPSWIDDFDDNAIDTNRWEKLEVGGTVAETDGQLKVTIPSGQAWSQAGLVTKHAYSMDGFSVEINVVEFDSLDEMILQICTTKTTSSDPFNEANWYRILKARYDGKIYIQRKVGGTLTTLATISYNSATGTLRITVSNGVIKFYENGVLRYSESYQLPSYDCYLYVFTSTLRERNSGTDAFDFFIYESSN